MRIYGLTTMLFFELGLKNNELLATILGLI